MAVTYSLQSSSDVTFIGNIDLDGSLDLVSGDYSISSDTWTLTEVNFYDDASLSLTQDVSLINALDDTSGVSFNFYLSDLDSLNDVLLSIGDDVTLSGLDSVNIYLSAELVTSLDEIDTTEWAIIDGNLVTTDSDYDVFIYTETASDTDSYVLYVQAETNDFTWYSASEPANIPEPTSTSLSLIALIGLCSRRRRH